MSEPNTPDRPDPDPDLTSPHGVETKLKRRSPRLIVIGGAACVLAVAGVLIVPGLLGPSQEEKDAAEQARVEAEEQAEAAAQAEEDYLNCEAMLAEGADLLSDLDSRLDGGLVYDEYEKAINKIESATPTLIPGEVSTDCEDLVYAPMEKARIAFGEAGSIWNDCIYDLDSPNCDAVESELQDQWWAANRAVDKMNEGRAAMRDAVDEEEAEAEDAEAAAEEAEAVVS